MTDRPLSILVICEGVVESHPLAPGGQVTLGRAETNDVRLSDPETSREHARLRYQEQLTVEDLGSANGTRLGGLLLKSHAPAPVEPGQLIELGSSMVVVQRDASTSEYRQLWSHGYFEARLEDRCASLQRTGRAFAILRVHLVGETEPQTLKKALTQDIKTQDLIAAYAPGDYEFLLDGSDRGQAERAASELLERLEALGLTASVGLALAPEHGRTAHALLERANHDLCAAPEPAQDDLVFESESIKNLVRLAQKVALGNISVLLLGETGVGKEVFAELIHKTSRRANRPFIKINCAALSETLLESELFGHEKGAFTGAVARKEGLLEAANTGTIFLDEIGEMPVALQAKLLRALEQRQITPVGAVKPRSIDLRFIAATNRDLERAALSGAFRADLLYRLNGVTLAIPPLRARAADVPTLAHRFLRRFSTELGWSKAPQISERAMALLVDYAWPGNIRELRNTMERASLLCGGQPIGPEHLPMDKLTASWTGAPQRDEHHESHKAPAWSEPEKAERQNVLDALNRCAGNQTRAAEMLNMSRRTFINRLNKYKIKRPRKS